MAATYNSLMKADVSRRPDLSQRALGVLIIVITAGALTMAILIRQFAVPPSAPLTQWLALAGTVLLLVPAVFSILKRTRLRASAPTWFVAHVVTSAIGLVLIIGHSAAGHWLSAPGLVLAGAAFLVVQGILARTILSNHLAELFAARNASFNYGGRPEIDRPKLARLIEQKRTLLALIDPHASEATFSLRPQHWFAHPLRALRYARLANAERSMVSARAHVGWMLAWWRPLHILVAALVVLGIAIHLITVLFFAGYVAGDAPVTWWHIAAWGRP